MISGAIRSGGNGPKASASGSARGRNPGCGGEEEGRRQGQEGQERAQEAQAARDRGRWRAGQGREGHHPAGRGHEQRHAHRVDRRPDRARAARPRRGPNDAQPGACRQSRTPSDVARVQAAGASLALAAALAAVAFGAGGGAEFDQTGLVETIVVLVAGVVIALAVLTGRGGTLHGTGAIAGLGAYVAVVALSVGWSITPDISLSEAGRAFTYLAVFAAAVMAAHAWRGAVQIAARALLIACVVVCGWALVTRMFPGELAEIVVGARLGAPFDYWNALSSVATIGIVPALWLGTRNVSAPATRALALPATGIFVLTLALTQSRGGILAAAAALLIWFAVAPYRLRSLAVLVIPTAVVLPVAIWALTKDAFTETLKPLPVARGGRRGLRPAGRPGADPPLRRRAGTRARRRYPGGLAGEPAAFRDRGAGGGLHAAAGRADGRRGQRPRPRGHDLRRRRQPRKREEVGASARSGAAGIDGLSPWRLLGRGLRHVRRPAAGRRRRRLVRGLAAALPRRPGGGPARAQLRLPDAVRHRAHRRARRAARRRRLARSRRTLARRTPAARPDSRAGLDRRAERTAGPGPRDGRLRRAVRDRLDLADTRAGDHGAGRSRGRRRPRPAAGTREAARARPAAAAAPGADRLVGRDPRDRGRLRLDGGAARARRSRRPALDRAAHGRRPAGGDRGGRRRSRHRAALPPRPARPRRRAERKRSSSRPR